MSQVAPINAECVKIESVSARSFAAPQTIQQVRVASNGYLSLLFSLTFSASFLYYLEHDAASIYLFAASWLFVPVIARFDRYTFDGQTLQRKGLIAFIHNRFRRGIYSLPISEIEQVETNSLRNINIGGRIFYRYRTEIFSKNHTFTINSNGNNHQQFVRKVLAAVENEKLDARSIDLRDYTIAPEKLNSKIAALQMPSGEFLESISTNFRSSVKREVRESYLIASERNDNWRVKSNEMRQLANELRVAGKLAQSIEAFRRALLWQPNDAGLIYEFARCLLVYASVTQTAKVARRAKAALRLAKMRGKNDAELLARIGEIYFQIDEFESAESAFKSALTLQKPNFRLERGLAEMALQNGKLAHVVHHYRAATFASENPATRNWANEETVYFSNLNCDDVYLGRELSRISLMRNILQAKRICWRITFFGLLMICGGSFFDEIIASIGWAFTMATMFVLAVLTIIERISCERTKFAG